MGARPFRMVPIDVLGDLMARLISRLGCDSEMTGVVAGVFLEANLRRIDHQGLDYLPKFAENVRRDKIAPNGRPRVVKQGGAFAFVDGGRGPGQFTGLFAAELAARMAKTAGAAAVGVTNSSDLYMVGYFADRMAAKGCAGILFSASPPLAHAVGGVERALGTNPFAVAVPSAGDHPFLIDLATTELARSTVRNAAYHGEALPPGCALDAEGRPTTDARAALAGALSPLGGAKGFGLQLFVAFLSGPLVGGAVGRAMLGWNDDRDGPAANKGHLFIAVDPAAFGDAQAFAEAIGAHFEQIKSSKKAPGASAIRIPGERVYRARAESMREGRVPIDEVVWENTKKLAAELGVEMPG